MGQAVQEDCLIHQDETERLFRRLLPISAALHPRGAKISFTSRRKREIVLSQSCDVSLSLSCVGLSYMFSNMIALPAYYLLYTDLCLRLGFLLPLFMYFVAQLPEAIFVEVLLTQMSVLWL